MVDGVAFLNAVCKGSENIEHDVIAPKEDKPFTLRDRASLVHGVVNSTIRLTDQVRDVLRIPAESLESTVCRTTVDDYQLQGWIFLVQYALDRLGDVSSSIHYNYTYRYLRRLQVIVHRWNTVNSLPVRILGIVSY